MKMGNTTTQHPRRGIRSKPVVASLLLLLPLLTGLAAASTEEREHSFQGMPQLSTLEQIDAEAQIFAEVFDISHDEALYRAEARRKFGVLLEELASEHSDVFAGASVEHKSDFGFTVYIAGQPEEPLRSLLESASSGGFPLTVVENRVSSLLELEERAAAAHAVAVGEFERTHVASWVDVPTGMVHLSIGLNEGEGRQEISRLISNALDPSIEVSVEFGEVTSDEHTYGGALTTTSSNGTVGCTTAFKVEQGNTDGILTAGHCADNRWYNMGPSNNYQMTYQDEHLGQWGDFQWHTTSHIELDDFYSTSTNLVDVTGFRPVTNMAFGDLVVGFGRVSGSQDSLVEAVNVTRTVGSNTYGRQVKLFDDVFTNGDSGSPWFFAGEAWGVHGGNCGGDDCFSAIDFVDEALGVNLATS